jgi:hypothetical protein
MMLAALAAAKPVFADDEHAGKVVAVHADPTFLDATRVALVSWHVDVVTSDAAMPGTNLDVALESARRIARAEDARAVVWIEGGSLWVYDDRAHAIAVRPLPSPPPWDEATSAAIALTVKTLLLSAFEAPQETHSTLPHREHEAPPTKKKTPPAPPAAIHTVRILTLAGLRVPTNASDKAAARFGVDLTYFPSFAKGRAGLALTTDVGPSVLVDHAPYFAGTFTDVIGAAQIRLRLPLRSWLGLELGVGPGVHFSALEGSSASLGLAGRVTRIDGSIEAMLGTELSWKILRVSPIVGTSFLLHYQHYAASGVQILDVPRGQMLYALRIGVELP